MIRKVYSILLLAAAVLMVTPSAQAQRTSPDTDRSGTAGSAWLLVPTTARSAALGTATTGGVAGMNGLEAQAENPANLMNNTSTGVIFSRMSYVEDIGINYFGVAQRFGNNNISLTVSAWDFGDIPVQTENEPEINPNTPTWTATFYSANLGYARQFTDRISAGVVAKVVNETMAEDMSANTVAFDAGVNYVVGETGLRFGIALKNFGPSMKYSGDGLARTVEFVGEDGQTRTAVVESDDFELPSALNVGVAYSTPLGSSASATVLGNFRANSYEDDEYSLGAELGLMNMVYVRGSYEYSKKLDTSFFDGWNVGAGLNLDLQGTRLAVDYGYRPTNVFGNVNVFTVSLGL